MMLRQLVIISGLSGAGRTEAMRAFEDLGYFCVDNLPPSLIPRFAEVVQESPDVEAAALVMDVRGRALFRTLNSWLDTLNQTGVYYQILYLEAEEETLIHRYKLSRRRHPLEASGRLAEAIRHEKDALNEIKGRADLVIDTTRLSSKQLRQRIMDVYRLDIDTRFQMRLVSFGFKHGLPKDADIVLDVRFLPNPHYIAELKAKTGEAETVRDYVLQFSESKETLERFRDMLGFLLPLFQQEGKPQATVAIGCTGGQHRSVVFVNELARIFQEEGQSVTIEHRDIGLANRGER